MTTKYTPRVGGLGERSLNHLRANGRALARDLAAAIDADVSAMESSLNLCVDNGLIKREVENGETFYTALEPITPLETVAETIDPIVVAPTLNLRPSHPPLPLLDRRNSALPDRRQATPTRPPPAESRHFEFGLFSDGRFVIEVGQVETTLTRDETVRLFAFVNQIEGGPSE